MLTFKIASDGECSVVVDRHLAEHLYQDKDTILAAVYDGATICPICNAPVSCQKVMI